MHEILSPVVYQVKKYKTRIIAGLFVLLVILTGVYFLKRGEKKSENIEIRTRQSDQSGRSDQSDKKSTLDISKEGEIVVDISGAVKNPGVYKLSYQSRIVDLLRLSGGVLSDSAGKWVSKKLNLSEKLQDSQKVYIPFDWDVVVDDVGSVDPLNLSDASSAQNGETSVSGGTQGQDTSAGSANISNKINVNIASKDLLDTLSGIGPTYAQRIIDNRPYKNISDVITKTKIPQTTLSKIQNLISF